MLDDYERKNCSNNKKNLYPRRKCKLKGVFKGRTIIVSKSYFFLNAQLFTKKKKNDEKTVNRDLFLVLAAAVY